MPARWIGMMSMFGRMKSMSADDFTGRSVEIPTMLPLMKRSSLFIPALRNEWLNVYLELQIM